MGVALRCVALHCTTHISVTFLVSFDIYLHTLVTMPSKFALLRLREREREGGRGRYVFGDQDMGKKRRVNVSLTHEGHVSFPVMCRGLFL